MPEPYLFIEEAGGLLERTSDADVAAIRLQADCIDALRRFRASGFALVLVVDPADAIGSAPAGVGRARDAFLDALFASQGIGFEARLTCGHDRDARCDCALPGIGLVADYLAKPELDRHRSRVVGDREETAALGRAMGLGTCIVGQSAGWAAIAHDMLDAPRRAIVQRKTRETDITVAVDLDRPADPAIETGIGFFDHMLEQLGKHGGFGLEIRCAGDLEVDEHHTIEDVALALGQAFREALGDKRGIGRFGFVLPMDEAQAQVALDLSGRAYSVFEGEFPREAVGGMPTELVGHFFRSLAESLEAALHVSVRGDNAHHMIEACFKGVARALRQAFARSGNDLPSTKGTL